MFHEKHERLADVLVNYSVAVRPKDKVMVQGSVIAQPLIEAVYAAVLKAGGHPLTLLSLPSLQELLFEYASKDQLKHVPGPYKSAVETYDASIVIMGSQNTKALTGVSPDRMVLSNRSQQELMQTVMRRAAAGEYRWVGTLYPTPAYAQDAEMGIHEYERFVYGACVPEEDDPVGYWKRFSAWQQEIVDWLSAKKELRVEGPGVDLRMSIDGRSFVNCDGHRNMPDGEVFTGPVEDSFEGHVRFSYPTTFQGRTLEGVTLRFEQGRVVEASADKGESFLLKTLDTDKGARYVGEFAIGTNKGVTRATGHTLFDEKINGSFHMALGAGMPETGSVNKSAIHWDLVCDLTDGGRIKADGEQFYENGEFAWDS